MLDDGLAGRLEPGRARSEALLPLVRVFAEPSPAVIKAVLHGRGQIASPMVRMPLSDASRAATMHALQVLAALEEHVAPLEPIASTADS